MKSLSGHFLRAATLYALAGMALGIGMAAAHDHSQMPTHAHLMLLGWVSMALYGLFYRGLADTPATMLMQAHKWLAHISLFAVVIALYSMMAGNMAFEPLAVASSFGLVITMTLFAVIVFKATKA